MKLNKLRIHAFRNIEHAELSTGPRFNILYGNNAQGKTNLLESIYLLGTMKSFKLAKNRDLVKWGNSEAVIRGWIDRNDVARDITVIIDEHGKKARIDNKALHKLSEFFGMLNVVVFSPEEIAMVRGMPEIRRRYLDRAIFSGDVRYLSLHQEYNKILKNRNALLKKGERYGLEIWNEQIADAGVRLFTKRTTYVRQLQGLLKQFYEELADGKESADINYVPHRLDRNVHPSEARSAILEALHKSSIEELRLGTTVIGPHRDDLEFSLNGKSLRHFGSQGQQRTFILALKMAEIEYLQREFGHPPVLLLDDMTSELDQERNRNLLRFLNSREMQVFITTTNLENIYRDEIQDCTTFLVKEGTVTH